MNNFEVYNLPHIITRNTYINKNTFDKIEQSEINSYIDKRIEEDINDYHYKLYHKEESKIKDIKRTELVNKKLKEYFDSSYLFKLKVGQSIENIDSKLESEDNKFSAALNRVIKKVLKERQHDYVDILVKLKESCLAYKFGETVEYYEEPSKDDLLNRMIEDSEEVTEENKPNKIKRYIKDKTNEIIMIMYDMCYDEFKESFKEYMKSYKATIEESIKPKMDSFKRSDVDRLKRTYRSELISIFNSVLMDNFSSINFVESGNKLILINRASYSLDKLELVSGYIAPERLTIYTKDIDSIIRYGETFTIKLRSDIISG